MSVSLLLLNLPPFKFPYGVEVFVECLKITTKCYSPIYTDPTPLKGVLVYGFTLFFIMFEKCILHFRILFLRYLTYYD